MLLRRVGGSGDLRMVLDYGLLIVQAGRTRAAMGGCARGAKRPSAGVPAVSREGCRPARRGAAAPDRAGSEDSRPAAHGGVLVVGPGGGPWDGPGVDGWS